MTCDAYDACYVAGKDDAHAELRAWQLGDHAATCGCELCQTVRAIVEHVLLAAQTPVLLPDHHIKGCAKPCRSPVGAGATPYDGLGGQVVRRAR